MWTQASGVVFFLTYCRWRSALTIVPHSCCACPVTTPQNSRNPYLVQSKAKMELRSMDQ